MLVAKPGLDGHDRGAKVIARALRDAGMEVIYTGLRQTPEMIVSAALQEDVNVIGLSILSGAHNAIVPRVMDLLKQNKMDDVIVVVGGIIPDQDMDHLKKIGVAAIFQPGTAMDDIVKFIRANMKPRTRADGRLMAEISTSRLRDILARSDRPHSLVLENFSPSQIPPLTSVLRGPIREARAVRLCGLARFGAGTGQAAPGPEYVLPSVLCAAFTPGIWCPEGRSIRLTCFDPDQLKAFDLAEIAGWFKQSAERIYAATAPIADFEIPLGLEAGMHKIERAGGTARRWMS